MAISLYQASVAQYLQILPSVIGLIDKAEAWTTEQGLSAEEVLGKQLAHDMWPLANQLLQTAAHSARALQAVESGTYRPLTTPPPLDFAELRVLLNEALENLRAVDAEELEARAGNVVALEFGGEVRMRFVAQDFLLSFAQPNFYFHVTAAYSILRGLGVHVGKRDYLGMPRIIQPA